MLAKGKVFVSKEKMAKLLSLPENTEVIAIRPKELDEGWEFLVLSAEETFCTKKSIPLGQMRRISVETLEQLSKPKEERVNSIIATATFPISDELKEDNKDVRNIFSNIIKNIGIEN